MPRFSRHAGPGEESNPNPLGRGCGPFTLIVLVTMAIGGGIGWMVYDGIGAGAGAFLVLAAWVYFIWS